MIVVLVLATDVTGFIDVNGLRKMNIMCWIRSDFSGIAYYHMLQQHRMGVKMMDGPGSGNVSVLLELCVIVSSRYDWDSLTL